MNTDRQERQDKRRTMFLLLILITAPWAHAQQNSSGCGPAGDANQQLLQRISKLEARVKELEVEQAAAAPSPAPEAPAEQPRANTVNDRLKLNVFGDVGFRASDQEPSTNSFFLGSLDLFMTARLSEKTSTLAEVLFIPSLADNSINPDVERLLLQYRYNDYLTAAIGRYHTSIGYYNTAFHQGAWFQTAVDRPFMYAFDDQGGFLPLQEVGITTTGAIPSGKLGLSYVAETGNGRNHLLSFDPAQNARDTNNGKSFNLALSSHPAAVSGLDIGFSIYHDYLTFSDNIDHSELIPTVHVVYLNSTYEFLNEAMLVRHVGSSTGAPGVWHTPAFYTQFSRKFSSYRPYFRYQYINASPREPIYGDPTDGPVVGRRNGPSFGLRYEFTEHSAFKLQYDRLQQRGMSSSNQLQSQFAFAF